MNRTLTFDGKKFTVGSYALQYALKSLGVTVNEIGTIINTDYLGLVTAMMYYSHVFACLKDGTEPTITNIDLYDFIDENGGVNGSLFAEFVKVMNVSIGITTDSAHTTDQPKKKATQ